MSDQNTTEPEEQAYPGHGPHSDGPGEPANPTGAVPEGVEPKFTVTPGTETTEERHELAEEQRAKIADERTDDEDGEDGEDDEPELTAEADDPEPVLPADDSPVHGESTIEQGSTDPTL